MNSMPDPLNRRHLLLRAGPGAWIGLSAISACSVLRPAAIVGPRYYALDDGLGDAGPAPAAAEDGTLRPTLVVDAPQAAPGCDSAAIVYRRTPHQREVFAHSEWIAPPARMLAPLIVAALARGGGLRAVVGAPSAARADLRLQTLLLRLEQDFGDTPSQVRLTLAATLVDDPGRTLLARREFDLRIACASEDAYGGVVAANLAVRALMTALAAFCRDAARGWRPPAR